MSFQSRATLNVCLRFAAYIALAGSIWAFVRSLRGHVPVAALWLIGGFATLAVMLTLRAVFRAHEQAERRRRDRRWPRDEP